MNQKQVLGILQKLKEENRVDVSENVLNSYINGKTKDKFDPNFLVHQSFFHSEVLSECLQIGTFKQGLPKTFTLTKNYQSLYSSDFGSIFEELKNESKIFEKKLKEKDSEVAFFRKFEISLDTSRKIYIPHFHYLVLSELEVEDIVSLSAICTYAKELSVVSKKNKKTSIERLASYLSKQFVTIVKDFKKSTWSGFELNRNNFKSIKDFVGLSYDVLKNTVIYKYYGEYKKIYEKKLKEKKEERKEYCERVLDEKQGNEEYFKILNMKLAREKKEEKRQEKEIGKAIEKQRKKRIKEYRAIAKAIGMNLNPNPRIDREKMLDLAYIVVSNLYKIDRQDEVFDALFGEKEKEGGSEMAKRRDKSEDFKNQMRLFKSREELEKEERIKERKQWLDEMEEFFSPDVNEVRQEIRNRKARVKELREIAEIISGFEYRTISESKIRLTVIDFLAKAYKYRLTSKRRLYGFNFALEFIKEIRLELSSSEFRVQERNYWRSGKEKVKKVIRPPPYKKVRILLIEMELFQNLKKNFRKKFAFLDRKSVV